MGIMPRPRPPHLHRERTRHGKAVWYVRVGKGPRIRIHAAFGTPDFEAEYHAATRCESAPKTTPARAGSLAWLIGRYRDSAAWTNLTKATRRQRENIFRHVMTSAGNDPYTRIDRRAIVAGRDRRRETPNAARHFVQTMRGLFDWAVEADFMKENPTQGVKISRPPTDGFHVWTDDECERFEKRWPLGTRERLAYDVILYTGLRRGDAVCLGRQHVRKGVITIRTEKTGEVVTLPILPPLQVSLDAAKDHLGEMNFLATAAGNPWRKEAFGNWFREACRKADVPGTAHGLRKTGATRAANRGASELELDSLFGWRGGRTSSVYTRQANRERLAHAAAAKMVDEKANALFPHHAKGAGENGKKLKKIK